MFTTNHFIFLGISLLIIVAIILINKFMSLSYRTNLIALFVVAIVSELAKIMINVKTIIGDDFLTSGGYLEYEDLPFHLCSIQIFFIIALMFFVKKESTKAILLNFMFPTMCIGATMALFIPTEGVDFSNPQVYQYFIYHAYIIGFAIYLVMSKTIEVTFKVMFRNIAYLFALSIIAIYINGILSFANTNFMFVSRPPLEGLPIFNMDNGWHWYFITIVLIGISILVLFHTPFAISNMKKKNNQNR